MLIRHLKAYFTESQIHLMSDSHLVTNDQKGGPPFLWVSPLLAKQSREAVFSTKEGERVKKKSEKSDDWEYGYNKLIKKIWQMDAVGGMWPELSHFEHQFIFFPDITIFTFPCSIFFFPLIHFVVLR